MWDLLFGNIGGELKKIAYAFFIVIILAGIIGGITFMVKGEILIGFLIAIIAFVLAYLISVCWYAFGELIECVQEISYNTRDKKDKQ